MTPMKPPRGIHVFALRGLFDAIRLAAPPTTSTAREEAAVRAGAAIVMLLVVVNVVDVGTQGEEGEGDGEVDDNSLKAGGCEWRAVIARL